MKKILILLFILGAFVNVKATHLMGGEITWECIKAGPDAGKYIFNVKVYRDCQGVPIATSMNLDVHNVPGVSNIPLTYIGATDISPSCDTINGPNIPFSCGGVNITAGNGNGAVEEHVYQSEPIQLLGTPDANGWHFTWSSCCRNAAISNLSLTGGVSPNEGFTLRAVMYSYTDSTGTVFPNNDCYDSSPKFYETPRTILEVGNGYTPFAFSNGFTYSHNAFDQEQDSISYSWDNPLDGFGYDYLNPNSTSLSFVPPYSYANPINGIFLNNITGRTQYPANEQGNFVTCTKVAAFKCGQLVSEIFREIQVVIIPPTCNLGDTTNGNIGGDTLCNVRPSVQPPFFYPASSAPFQWDTLAHCGDTIRFDFNAIDNDIYPNGSHQNLLFEVSGGQFYDYYNNIPCQNPPCATFNEVGTGATPPFTTVGGTGTGYFEWITSCNHVLNSCSGGIKPSVYTFVIKVQDDFCPAPAIENTSQVISITVFPSCDNLKTPVVTTSASCLNDGTAQVAPFGGTAPYVSYWFDMNGMPVNPSFLGAGDYVVRVTDSTQCESVDTFSVAGPSSFPSTSFSTNHVSCFGWNDGGIVSSPTGGQSPYNFLWSNGDTTQSISNLTAGTYILNLTDMNSCEVFDTVVVSEPALSSSSLTVTTCNNFNWNGASYDSTGTYNWLGVNSDGCDSTSTLNLTVVNTSIIYEDTVVICFGESYVTSTNTYTVSGDYIDSVWNSGCLSMTYLNLTVGASFVPSITQASNVLQATISGGFSPYTFSWSTSDITQSINISSVGTYWLVVTDSLSCVSDTIYYHVNSLHTGLLDHSISDLKIYPNPSENKFYLKFFNAKKQDISMRILNALGGVLFSEDIHQYTGEYTKQIDLIGQAKGIYFIEICADDTVINKKLILR